MMRSTGILFFTTLCLLLSAALSFAAPVAMSGADSNTPEMYTGQTPSSKVLVVREDRSDQKDRDAEFEKREDVQEQNEGSQVPVGRRTKREDRKDQKDRDQDKETEKEESQEEESDEDTEDLDDEA